MTDIVEQLENAIAYNKRHYEVDPLHRLALIEINRLRAEIARTTLAELKGQNDD
jgi:hypothetical protein